MRLDATGAIFCHTGVTEQGQGAEAVIAQCVATSVRRVDGPRARHHGRHRQHALWRRHLGVARGRHRRRSGVAGRQGAAAERAGGRRLASCRPSPRRSTSATASWSTPTPATSASASTRWRASPTSAPTRCRAGFQAELMATRHYVPRAWAVRLHQRHPGELSRGRHRHRLRQAAQALVRRGLRHRDQSAAGRRAGARRRGAGHRRRAVRALPL